MARNRLIVLAYLFCLVVSIPSYAGPSKMDSTFLVGNTGPIKDNGTTVFNENPTKRFNLLILTNRGTELIRVTDIGVSAALYKCKDDRHFELYPNTPLSIDLMWCFETPGKAKSIELDVIGKSTNIKVQGNIRSDPVGRLVP